MQPPHKRTRVDLVVESGSTGHLRSLHFSDSTTTLSVHICLRLMPGARAKLSMCGHEVPMTAPGANRDAFSTLR